MHCDRAREAISARIDGEDDGLRAGVLDAHLVACPACRDWQQRAHAVTRRARLGSPLPDRDLSAAVLAALPPARPAGWRRGLLLRAGLITVALAQLAITVPLLVMGHDHGADAHAAHEIGSFDLGLAIAFVIGAVRPRLSAGLAWPSGVAAGSLLVTAISDLISGATFGADETQHLIAVAGALLLFWQARTSGARSGKPALTAPQPQAIRLLRAPDAELAAMTRPGTQPDSRDGGSDAARVSGPGVAARDGRRVA